jgi:hypothetical protein
MSSPEPMANVRSMVADVQAAEPVSGTPARP